MLSDSTRRYVSRQFCCLQVLLCKLTKIFHKRSFIACFYSKEANKTTAVLILGSLCMRIRYAFLNYV
jgi:hypothetical protein